MPSHDRVRLHEHQRRAPIPPESGHHDPKEPIVRPKTRAFGGPFHGPELLPQCHILQDQFFMTAARQRQRTPHQDQQLQH
jgi:hypothetical protein